MTKLEEILQQQKLERQNKVIKTIQPHIETLKYCIGKELSSLLCFSPISSDEFEVKSVEIPEFKFKAYLYEDDKRDLWLKCDGSICKLSYGEHDVQRLLAKSFFLSILESNYDAWQKQVELERLSWTPMPEHFKQLNKKATEEEHYFSKWINKWLG